MHHINVDMIKCYIIVYDKNSMLLVGGGAIPQNFRNPTFSSVFSFKIQSGVNNGYIKRICFQSSS